MKDAGCHGNGACATQDNVAAVVQGSVLNIDLSFPAFPGSAGLCAGCSTWQGRAAHLLGWGQGEFPPLSRAAFSMGWEKKEQEFLGRIIRVTAFPCGAHRVLGVELELMKSWN